MLKNEWLLDLDLKFEYSRTVPRYRRGDTAILKMRLHDNSKLYDLSTATDAKVIIGTPSGLRLDSSCLIVEDDTSKLLVFQFEPLHMLEIGIYNILLTVSDGLGKVSPPPFKVRFFDSLSESSQSLIQIIQDLQNQVNSLENDLVNAVMNSDKGIPNGVASTDETGKLMNNQIPNSINNHLDKKVYLQGVHGFRVSEAGIGMYEDNGTWKNLGYSENSISLLTLNTSIANGIVTLIYGGVGTATLQKWAVGDKTKAEFQISGQLFEGLTFTVKETGIHTIYYEDDSGNLYLHKLDVQEAQLGDPTIDIIISNSGKDITINPSRQLAIMKWDDGNKDVLYFQNNGKEIINDRFTVPNFGTYTVYYKTLDNREYVKVFEAIVETTPAEVQSLTSGTTVLIGEKYWQVLNPNTGLLWYADNMDSSSTPYLGHIWDSTYPRANRTRDFLPTKIQQVAYQLNNTFYNALQQDFKNAIKTTTWKNGTEDNENSKTVSAKIGLFTLSEWKQYRNILDYSKLKPNTGQDWMYTMTKISALEESIYTYPRDIQEFPRDGYAFDIFQYTSSEGAESTSTPRPIVYVNGNYVVNVPKK